MFSRCRISVNGISSNSWVQSREAYTSVSAAAAGDDAVGPGRLRTVLREAGLRLMMLVMEEEAERLVGPRH